MTAPTPSLAAALAKVQGQLPKLERDRTVTVQQKNGDTYSYSYATLANLSETVLPLLASHGLSFVAMPGAGSDGKMCVRYQLLHESGESLTGEFPISGDGGIQMIGGRITYARRYCLAAIVGVAADEDDEARLADEGKAGTVQRVAPVARQNVRAATPAREGRSTTQRAQRRPDGPPLPGEEPAKDGITGPVLASREQLEENFRLLTEAGYTDKAEALTFLAKVVGHDVRSRPELTADEIERVNHRLRATDEPPPADEELGPNLLNVKQRNHIMALAGELGLTNRDLRLEYISQALRRTVETTNDLSRAEAHDVIELMLAAKAKQDEAPDKTLRETQKEQAATLRRTRGAATDGD